MTEQTVHAPEPGELPSIKQLNRATAIAAGVAAVLLVTVVLPAEYGVDPLRTGQLLGLTKMGQMKREAAHQAATSQAAETEAPLAFSLQSGEQTVTLAPSEGREVKATMQAGGEFDYQWSTNGLPVHYELHGEPKGAAKGVFTSYDIGVSKGMAGKFRAPFAGTQGWYWRNDGPFPATVTVKAKGTWAKFVIVPKKPR